MRRQLGFAAVLALALMGLASARGPPVDGPADACQACIISVRILEDFLCDPAATDFLVEFVEKQICSRMDDKAQCHNLAEGLLPTVIQWFRASATPASLCASAGVCGSAVLQVAPLNKPALRVRDTSECAMCKFVVRTVKQQLEDSQTLDKIKEVALKICGDLPNELAEGCTDFVNNYGSMVSELVEEMDPDMVCSLIGTCMEALTQVPPPALPAALLQALAASQIFQRPPPPPVFSAFLGLPPPMFGPGPHGGMMGGMMAHGGMGMGPMGMGPANDACDYCKMAVIEAHSLVSNPTVQAEMLNYTKAVCDSFPSFAEPCKAYVDMYAPLVFSLLEQYLVPDAVCVQTGMCPPSHSFSSAASLMGHPTSGGGRSWSCWLLDGWFGELLRHLGLGGILPHQEGYNGRGHEQQGAVHATMKQQEPLLLQAQ